jgi:hypothetical protein
MNDFSDQLLKKIEQEHIRPVPRWVVETRRVLVWVSVVLGLLCGGLLLSLLFLAALQVDLEFLRVSSLGSALRLLLEYVPLVWVGLFILFCVIEVILLRGRTRLYRYPISVMVGLVLLGVSVFGLGFYVSRIPARVQSSMERRLPPPLRARFVPGRPLPRPEEGVLFGEVVEVSTSTFQLLGPHQDRWTVRRAPGSLFPFPSSGRRILLEGRISSFMEFEAHHARPYKGPPGGPGRPPANN